MLFLIFLYNLFIGFLIIAINNSKLYLDFLHFILLKLFKFYKFFYIIIVFFLAFLLK